MPTPNWNWLFTLGLTRPQREALALEPGDKVWATFLDEHYNPSAEIGVVVGKAKTRNVQRQNREDVAIMGDRKCPVASLRRYGARIPIVEQEEIDASHAS